MPATLTTAVAPISGENVRQPDGRPAVVETSTGSAALEQLVERDRQVPDALAGSVVDRIGGGGRRSGNADLADPVRTHRRVWIGYIGPDYVDLRHVHVHGHVIFGEAGGS